MELTYCPCNICNEVNAVNLTGAVFNRPLCKSCYAALPIWESVSETNRAGLAALLSKSPMPVLIHFVRANHTACRTFAGLYERLAKVFSGQVVFARIPVDEDLALRQKYHPTTLPSLVLFESGREVGKRSAMHSPTMITHWLRTQLDRAMTARVFSQAS